MYKVKLHVTSQHGDLGIDNTLKMKTNVRCNQSYPNCL